ncbi:hypothetical protein HHK36_031297 [Tetracentron sinense]|uniref:BHLH domain-containing protein n=1 Tax=Tetracentron sinense TaxID=13715 RepID=A0A834YB93_TETSI|nr:hypothetical protein HHK36_031297 [Tetracentron sinense]
MDSANLHHQHQLQEQLVGYSSLATPSYYGVGSHHAWNQNILLNGGNGVLSNSRNSRQKNDTLVPLFNTSMIQDLGFHWSSNAGSFINHSAHEQHLPKIKFSDSFPTFTELNNNSPSRSYAEEFHSPSTSYIKHEQQDLHDLSEKLFLESFSSSCQINGLQLSAGDLYSNTQNCATFGGVATSSRGNFSQIFPSTHISNLNPSFLGMNLQALNLLNSAKFSGSFCQPSHQNLGLFKESLSFGLNCMQESSPRPSNSPSKRSPFNKGVTAVKRGRNFSEPKASKAAAKKPRFESRSSCPPIKVRKEKLGDRIAALQQLVAPFGKVLLLQPFFLFFFSTDTASVLTEATGYIKFLQHQVQVSSEDGNEEPKRDLRSRGLCLVPLSCTSYVTGDSAGVWPPPNFSGRT